MNTWLSLLPPLLAIAIAFISRQVLLALFSGLVAGVLILHGLDYSQYPTLLDKYLVGSVANTDHVYIILFSLFISGSVAILYKNGGMQALIRPFIPLIKTRKQAQWSTYLSGVILFFDDYANTLVVGNTMRSITDHHKISREKLAYLVDSTSAPIAAIALITTWIGAELGYISDAVTTLGISESAYSIFLNSLPYAFYPIFTLAFIAILTSLGKDFGPMYNAEIAAQNHTSTSEQVDEKPVIHQSFWFGAGPILMLIIVTFSTLVITGKNETTHTLGEIMGNANSYTSLLWGSFVCLITTLILSLVYTAKKLGDLFEEMVVGFGDLLPAISVLVLAWALSDVISDLKTSDFIIGSMPSNFSVWALPITVFLISAAVSFSTGTSWGTMAIIYPLAIPLAFSMMEMGETNLLYACVASVLSGAVFGDHCSPISDTTILSSLASGCNHIQHVRTQLPYALVVAGVSLLCLFISAFISVWACFIIGIFAMYLLVKRFGKITL